MCELHINLGLCLQDMGDLAGAEKEHREAIRLNPKHSAARRHLGQLLCAKMRDPSGAAREYKELLKLDPSNVLAHVQLGLFLEELRDFPGAELAYRTAIELDPRVAVIAHHRLPGVICAQQTGAAKGE